MEMIIFFIVTFVSLIFGTFAFAQIIGSLRTRQKFFLVTIIVWVVLLFGEYYLAKLVVSDYMSAFYIGTGISFLIMLFQRKIE